MALAEDMVQEALVSAMLSFRLGVPANPRAWILQVAKRRAIDVLRRDRKLSAWRPELETAQSRSQAVDLALSPEADAANQLAMMFAICDDGLASETHVTLILRLLCGLSAPEIARAFLVDVPTIDRRLHRGRRKLEERGELADVTLLPDVLVRQLSVERAIYLLFNEGYHGSDVETPLHPAMCADALRLAEMLLTAPVVEHRTVHALAALFCFNAARLPSRLDRDGVIVPLAEQDRTHWDQALLDRGGLHLGQSASGDHWTRWHLEAGIAFEHTRAPSVQETNWSCIVDFYDALVALAPSPVVALNRALALAELRGIDAGRDALSALAGDPRLVDYSFYWAARADIERRAGKSGLAKKLYLCAVALAKSPPERLSYERRLRALEK